MFNTVKSTSKNYVVSTYTPNINISKPVNYYINEKITPEPLANIYQDVKKTSSIPEKNDFDYTPFIIGFLVIGIIIYAIKRKNTSI